MTVVLWDSDRMRQLARDTYRRERSAGRPVDCAHLADDLARGIGQVDVDQLTRHVLLTELDAQHRKVRGVARRMERVTDASGRRVDQLMLDLTVEQLETVSQRNLDASQANRIAALQRQAVAREARGRMVSRSLHPASTPISEVLTADEAQDIFDGVAHAQREAA